MSAYLITLCVHNTSCRICFAQCHLSFFSTQHWILPSTLVTVAHGTVLHTVTQHPTMYMVSYMGPSVAIYTTERNTAPFRIKF